MLQYNSILKSQSAWKEKQIVLRFNRIQLIIKKCPYINVFFYWMENEGVCSNALISYS
jgi:hypothetical protein